MIKGFESESIQGNQKSVNSKAIGEFLQRLRETEGDNLLQVNLFGSVARGNDNEYSDY